MSKPPSDGRYSPPSSWVERLLRLSDGVGLQGVAAAMLITVAGAIIASLADVPTVDFGMTASATGLTVRTASHLDCEDLTGRSVDIAGVRQARWSTDPGMPIRPIQGIRADGGASATISRLHIPAGWNLTVESEGEGRQRILANPFDVGSVATLSLAVPKGARLRVTDSSGGTVDRSAVEEEEVFLTLDRVDISLTLPTSRTPLARRLQASAIALRQHGIDEAGAADPGISEVGSIRDGILWIAHVPPPPKPLGPLDRIAISGIVSGAVSLEAMGGSWLISARGSASKITNQLGGAAYSLKPHVLAVVMDSDMLKVGMAIISAFAGMLVSKHKKNGST